MIRFILAACFVFTLTSCAVNQESPATAGQTTDQERTIDGRGETFANDLTAYFRGISRLDVRGVGPRGSIRMRGDNGILNTSGRPLFVIDGVPNGYSYRMLYNSLNVEDIASVKVLNGVSQTNRYGNQASGGAIEITLKEKAARRYRAEEADSNEL